MDLFAGRRVTGVVFVEGANDFPRFFRRAVRTDGWPERFGNDKTVRDQGRDIVEQEIGRQAAGGSEAIGFGIVAAAFFVDVQRAPDQMGVGQFLFIG